MSRKNNSILICKLIYSYGCSCSDKQGCQLKFKTTDLSDFQTLQLHWRLHFNDDGRERGGARLFRELVRKYFFCFVMFHLNFTAVISLGFNTESSRLMSSSTIKRIFVLKKELKKSQLGSKKIWIAVDDWET